MKIRSGFVSNSSSSSFVVAFDREPTPEILKTCFPGEEIDVSTWGAAEMVETDTVVSYILDGIEPLTDKNIVQYFYDYEVDMVRDFIKKHPGKRFYAGSFEDHDNIGIFVEHEWSFEDFESLRVSHH